MMARPPATTTMTTTSGSGAKRRVGPLMGFVLMLLLGSCVLILMRESSLVQEELERWRLQLPPQLSHLQLQFLRNDVAHSSPYISSASELEARIEQLEEVLKFKRQQETLEHEAFYSTTEQDLRCRERKTMSKCLDVESIDPTNQTCVWCSSLSICVAGNQIHGPESYRTHCPYWCGNGPYLTVSFFTGCGPSNQRVMIQNAALIASLAHVPLLMPALLYRTYISKQWREPPQLELPFSELYNETHFVNTLSKTTCVYPLRAAKAKLKAVSNTTELAGELRDNLYALGWQAVEQINRVRNMSGFMEIQRQWGVWPETYEERSLMRTIFDAFVISNKYQKLANQFVQYLREQAESLGGTYSAIHLRVEIEVMKFPGDPPEELRASVDRDIHPSTKLLYLATGQVDEDFAKPHIDAVCLDRPWKCVRKEEIPIEIPLDVMFNFDTAFTVELEILKEAESVLLYRFSTMSMVAEAHRQKLGRQFRYYGSRSFDCQNLQGYRPPLATFFRI